MNYPSVDESQSYQTAVSGRVTLLQRPKDLAKIWYECPGDEKDLWVPMVGKTGYQSSLQGGRVTPAKCGGLHFEVKLL